VEGRRWSADGGGGSLFGRPVDDRPRDSPAVARFIPGGAPLAPIGIARPAKDQLR